LMFANPNCQAGKGTKPPPVHRLKDAAGGEFCRVIDGKNILNGLMAFVRFRQKKNRFLKRSSHPTPQLRRPPFSRRQQPFFFLAPSQKTGSGSTDLNKKKTSCTAKGAVDGTNKLSFMGPDLRRRRHARSPDPGPRGVEGKRRGASDEAEAGKAGGGSLKSDEKKTQLRLKKKKTSFMGGAGPLWESLPEAGIDLVGLFLKRRGDVRGVGPPLAPAGGTSVRELAAALAP